MFTPLNWAQCQKIHSNDSKLRLCTHITVSDFLLCVHFSLLFTFIASYLYCYPNLKLIYSPGLQLLLVSSLPPHPVCVSQSPPTMVPLHLLFLPTAHLKKKKKKEITEKMDWKTNAKCLKSQKSWKQFWQHRQFFFLSSLSQKQAVNTHQCVLVSHFKLCVYTIAARHLCLWRSVCKIMSPCDSQSSCRATVCCLISSNWNKDVHMAKTLAEPLRVLISTGQIKNEFPVIKWLDSVSRKID